jgi:transcriptional regulator with XRE-family HTH domain
VHAVQRIESGASPSVEVLVKIARGLDVGVSFFFEPPRGGR